MVGAELFGQHSALVPEGLVGGGALQDVEHGGHPIRLAVSAGPDTGHRLLRGLLSSGVTVIGPNPVTQAMHPAPEAVGAESAGGVGDDGVRLDQDIDLGVGHALAHASEDVDVVGPSRPRTDGLTELGESVRHVGPGHIGPHPSGRDTVLIGQDNLG